MSLKPRELHSHNDRSNFTERFRNFWYGKPPKIVKIKAVTGSLAPAVKAKVTKRINEIARVSGQFKIGVMGDTQVRMDCKVYRAEFEYVERIYKTTSEQSIRDYEVELIKKFKAICPNKICNISEARAARLTTYNGYYYIYVVYNTQT